MQGINRSRVQRAGAVLVALVAMLTLVLLARGEQSKAASLKPNIIVFTTDDQTVRDMLALPRTQAHIGGGGATFLRSYVSFPLCCPSRVTMWTGQYAHNHHVLGNTPPSGGYGLFNDQNYLPIWLQSAGYRTIHIGKLPNGYPPNGNAKYQPPGWGPFPLKGEFYGFTGPGSSYYGFSLNENGVPKQYSQEEYQTDVYRDIAVDRIGKHFDLFSDSPLYLELQFFAPHDPNQPAVRHQGYFASAPLPVDASFNEKDNRDKPAWLRRVRRMGGGLISKVTTRYRGRLETLLAVDEAINSIMNVLAARGQLGNTYVLFTSDNGFNQGQLRLHQGKFVPYEASAQVPLMIRGPGITPGGQSKTLVSNVDLAPTILDMADAAPGLTQDGRSLLPYAADPTLRSTRPVLLETGPPGAIGEVASASGGRRKIGKFVRNLDLDKTAQLARVVTAPRYRGIRTGRYLLVKYGDGGRELYDLRTDRLETNSVYKDTRYAPVRKFLIKALAKLTPCIGVTCNAEIGKPPKPLAKPKKPEGKRKTTRPTTPAPTVP
jgi:N-acetylglucosamine-6-sulfatase